MPFVSIEGIDGSGKTEQVRLLVEHLRGTGRTVLQTKEPDGGQLGAEIRAILTRGQRCLSPTEQLLLVSAARFDHVRRVIRPALLAGHWVVSDRFIDSTYAFQVAVSDIDIKEMFRSVRDIVVGATMPNITIVLDLPVDVARTRRNCRNDAALDPAEAERDFFAIRNGLLAAARLDTERCRIVDGNRPVARVAHDIWQLIEPLL